MGAQVPPLVIYISLHHSVCVSTSVIEVTFMTEYVCTVSYGLEATLDVTQTVLTHSNCHVHDGRTEKPQLNQQNSEEVAVG